MASKSSQEQALSTENVEELLDTLDKNMERIKTLYEQYFLGIQKQAPTFLHTDIERKLRDLTQLNIRNTGMRYRLATLQQKFGAYNSYWKRTLRQIENGTYIRNLSKIGREAIRTGAEIPDEILAAMPKRMREQVLRDREQALAISKRRNRSDDTQNDELLDLAEGEPQPPQADDVAAMISEPSFVKKELKTRGGAHIIADDDFDLDKFFSEVEQENTETGPPPKPAPAPAPVVAPRLAPSQASRPNPIAPGAAAARGDVPVESMQGPFPRAPTPDPRQTGPIPPVQRPSGQIPVIPPVRPTTGQVPVIPPVRQTGPVPTIPQQRPTGPMPPVDRPTGPIPTIQQQRPTGPIPTMQQPRQTGPVPTVPSQRPTGPMPPIERPTGPVPTIPAQQRPAAGAQPPINPRPAPRPQTPVPVASQKPPPGMSDADVNALYQKYVQAKQLVGEQAGARDREKLLKTINSQAPKIMEQYKAKGVDFSVVVKDNQVIIRAKPKP